MATKFAINPFDCLWEKDYYGPQKDGRQTTTLWH